MKSCFFTGYILIFFSRILKQKIMIKALRYRKSDLTASPIKKKPINLCFLEINKLLVF
jgi:hypothetical protein